MFGAGMSLVSVTTVSFITSMRLPNSAYAVETPF